MARNTYVTKGYSTYTNISSRQGSYDHRPKEHVNWYVVETTTIERVRIPAIEYTNFSGLPSEIEFLKEFIDAPSLLIGPKYAPKDHHEGYEQNYGQDYENSSPPRYYEREDLVDNFINKVQNEASQTMKTSNFPSPNRYRPSSPVHSYASEEDRPIRTGNFSGPNKNHPSSLGSERAQHVSTGNFSGPNNCWQSAGPSMTHHPLTTTTNDINEAIRFLKESVNYSQHSGPQRTEGVVNDLSTRAQPIEPERRYAKPVFVGATIEPHNNNTRLGSIIDSNKAIWKYRGARVP